MQILHIHIVLIRNKDNLANVFVLQVCVEMLVRMAVASKKLEAFFCRLTSGHSTAFVPRSQATGRLSWELKAACKQYCVIRNITCAVCLSFKEYTLPRIVEAAFKS